MSRRDPATATIDVVDDWDDAIDTVLCDLDGVIWLAHQPIDGSVEAVGALRDSGRRVLFVTNNSFATRAEHEAALARIGIDAAGDVLSSAMAAARLIEHGQRVLVAGGPGVAEAAEARGAEVVVNTGSPVDGRFDAVLVGLHRDFDYDRLAVAAEVVRAGATLIGTNADTTYPTPRGLLPGGGSILAAIASASGTTPLVAGKPEQPMADLVTSVLIGSSPAGDGAGTPMSHRAIMVGDRPETDGVFAGRLGCRFALVRSGVVAPGSALVGRDQPNVDLDVADLAAVARRLAA